MTLMKRLFAETKKKGKSKERKKRGLMKDRHRTWSQPMKKIAPCTYFTARDYSGEVD